ncbi:MAG: DUF2892 domain-containing protein [Zoogloeaceae bacterium]|jgi:hypothetical protein|nr:DUF2892 domain-containing protein [Zoogloeaceae bacterium]
MQRNTGNLDRILRIILGIALIALTATGIIGVWGWLGVVPLATGVFGYCALYSLLGIRTCSAGKCACFAKR